MSSLRLTGTSEIIHNIQFYSSSTLPCLPIQTVSNQSSFIPLLAMSHFLPIVCLIMLSLLQGAQKGYDLLKKKSDALTVRFRALLKQIYATKSTMGGEMKDASFSLAEAVWAADNKFKYVPFSNFQHSECAVGVCCVSPSLLTLASLRTCRNSI